MIDSVEPVDYKRIDDKRSAILDATLHLISQHGFHGTAMSKIAAEAGVSAGIIYHYFASKDALIDELYIAIKRRSAVALLVNISPQQPIRHQLRQALHNILYYFVHHPTEAGFMEQYMGSPYFRPEVEARAKEYYLPMMNVIKQAEAEMVIKRFPDIVTTTLTMDVAISLAKKHEAGLVEMNDDLIARVVDALWDAIRQ